MRTILFFALLCIASMLLPCAHAQQSDADHQALADLLAKAAKGDAESQFEFGQACNLGSFGLPKDPVEAVKWFHKAAEENHAMAQHNLGVCYRDGQGVAKDEVEAVKWFRKAAEQDCAEAQTSLGVCYYMGQGVKKDYVEAVNWYRKAAEQNYAGAQYNLGNCYYMGQGVEKDEMEAVKWFRKAAQQGNAEAQFNLGNGYRDGQGVAKDEVEAVKWFRKAAEQNSAPAQSNLGFCYANGLGVAKDEVEAVKWYRKAAEQNDAPAQYNLGVCYFEGLGVVKDYAEAMKWWRKAAGQNHAMAQHNLGNGYREGQGVAKDYAEAVNWYRKAAEQDYASAQSDLGVCYLRGLGVAKDEAEAVKWFRRAAEQNDAIAQASLGGCYLIGLGVAKDEVEAYKRFLLAAAQGHKGAQLGTPKLERIMSREQVAEGKRRADEWLAQWKARAPQNPVRVEDDVTLRWEFGSKEALADWPGPDPAIYLGCGEVGGPGTVVQLDRAGKVLGTFDLADTPYGLAADRAGLVAALPGRNVAKVVRIGRTGKVETLLENARTLPAPIAVAADPGTGDVLVADNVADVILLLPGGKASEARVVLAIDGHKGDCQDMSVAFAADEHLLLGGDGPIGVYRFKGGPAAALGDPVVGERGGVMSARGAQRWAAALGGELRVFEGTSEVAALPYPAGRRLRYSAAVLGPGGTPILALYLDGNQYEVVEADMDRKGFKTLFGWDKSRVVCLAIGPKMAWRD